jgi:site-specific recombinase XerD
MKNSTNEQWIASFERYLKRRYPGRTTAKHYISDMHIFLKQYTGSILNVTSADVDAFVDAQQTRGLAVTTVNRRVSALKAFFDFAAEQLAEPERANPVSWDRHGSRQPKYLPRDLNDEQAQQFMEVIDVLRDRAMVTLMLYAGLRVGEVTDLCPGDITVPHKDNEAIRLRVLGKGRKERMAYLDRAAADSLLAYLEERSAASPQQPLFRNQLGQRITVSGVQDRVRKYATLSGVSATCHRLRHTYARWMAEGGVPVLSLARLMGHAHLQSTQRYIDSADPQVRQAYEVAMGQATQSTTSPVQSADPTPLPDRTETATVHRPDPPFFDAHNWQLDWPTWLREGCLDWLRHQWWQWKPSQRKHHTKIRLSQWRIFWNWQLTQPAAHDFHAWDDLHYDDIEAFVDAQLERGLKETSIRSILDGLYAVLRFLFHHQRLHAIPPRPKIVLPNALPRHLAADELLALETHVKQLCTVATDEDWLTIALYYVLAHGGLRISEALDLHVRDIDLTARRIRIQQGKGRRDRIVCLTASAVSALRTYLDTVPHAPGDLLFTWHHRPLSYAQALHHIRRLGEDAGVQSVSPIRLRHTFATTLLNNGMTLDALRRLMGHEHLTTTLIYARLADQTVESQYQEAMERVTI